MHYSSQKYKNDNLKIYLLGYFLRLFIILLISINNYFLEKKCQLPINICVRVPFFSSAQWPKDPGPDNYGLMDWA